MSSNQASITAVLGASGSGKSTFIKRTIAKDKPARLLVWDPMHEYGALGTVTSRLSDLVDAMGKAGKGGKFALVFQPTFDEKTRAKQFNTVCRLAMAAGKLTFVVEELRFVTTPSRAPEGWARVTMTGRHVGLRVLGASQRPASIDKDFLGNCTSIRSGRLAYPEDVTAVAKAMRVPAAQIDALKPLEWIEKNMATGKVSRGKLTF